MENSAYVIKSVNVKRKFINPYFDNIGYIFFVKAVFFLTRVLTGMVHIRAAARHFGRWDLVQFCRIRHEGASVGWVWGHILPGRFHHLLSDNIFCHGRDMRGNQSKYFKLITKWILSYTRKSWL